MDALLEMPVRERIMPTTPLPWPIEEPAESDTLLWMDEEAAEPEIRLRMSEEEFIEWCDEDTKAEWINGEVIMHSPISTGHARIAKFLVEVIDIFVRKHKLGEVLTEVQVRSEELHRRRVPDLIFIAKERKDIIQTNHIEGAPDLAIEITSPDSLSRDWREKFWEYQTSGVREYWVIDPMAEKVEAYALGEDKRYRRIKQQGRAIHSTVLPNFYLKTNWLWKEPLPDPLDILKELGVL